MALNRADFRRHLIDYVNQTMKNVFVTQWGRSIEDYLDEYNYIEDIDYYLAHDLGVFDEMHKRCTDNSLRS